MKYLKYYKVFEWRVKKEIDLDLRDVFHSFLDFGMNVTNIHTSYWSKDDDKLLNIRIEVLDQFPILDEDVYIELDQSIKHVESLIDCEFSNIYFSFYGPSIINRNFDNASNMKEYISQLSNDNKKFLKGIDYFVLSFKIDDPKKLEEGY